MKTKQFLPALLALALTAGLGCSKKSDDAAPTVNDCQKNNYGTIALTYRSSVVRHSVLVTLGPGHYREKTSAVGLTADSLHLHPGTYPVEVASLNAQGAATHFTNQTITITQCGNVAVNVVD